MARLNKTPLTLRVRRGTVAQITANSPAPYQKEGELAYATDTGGFYISDGTQFNLLAAGLQDLQSVTDVGNTTTNTIDTAGTKSDYFLLDTLATPTLQPGMFGWNDAFGTADLRLKGNNVTLQVGQEILARVVNKTGADLLESEYKVVRVRIASEGGAQGQRLAVVLAQGDNDPDSVTTLGIVTETILDNQEGFITILGNVSNIDTTGTLQGETWVDGDVLYLSPTTPGGLTKVPPVSPNHTVTMGYVVYAHQNQGKIFVKVDNGYELDELHNVLITSAASGQLLRYNGTVWENWTPNFLTTVPTLDQVTTAGNTTTNSINTGTLISTGSGVTARNTGAASVLRVDRTDGKIAALIAGTSFNGFYFDESGGFGIQRVSRSVAEGNLFPAISDFLLNGSTGNVLIGTTTDAGYKLDVNGTARFSGSIRTQTGSEEVAIDFAGIYMNRFYSYIRPDINNSRALFFGDATKGSVDWGSVTFHTTGFSVNATNMSFLTGNVGVGTTSPYYKIHTVFTDNTTTLSGGASGNWGGNGIRIDNASTTTGAMALIQFRTSTTDWHIGNRLVGITPDRSDFFFKHENNEYVTFLNNGNVGINTTSPFARLHVRDGYTNTGTLAVGHQSFPGLLYSSADTGEFRIDNRSSAPSGYISFYPNGEGGTLGNEAMRIIANRNVGIGTTSPTYKLHVAGTTRNTLTRIDITPTSSTLALDIRGTGTPNDYFSVSNGTSGANDVFFPIFFYKAASYGYNGGPNRYPSGVYAGGFVAAVDDIAYNNATGAGAAMHFNARNYTNTGGLNNRALFSWGNWFTTHMVMFPTGNLVLGSQTDNGLGKLQVEGDVTASVYHAQGLMGWSGVIPIPGNPPGMQNIEVTGGIITNVF